MTSIYYVPKKPVSIPLFNNDTKSYVLYFEDGEVDVPAELFFKLFKREEAEEHTTVFKKDEPKPSITEFIKENYSKEEIEKESHQLRDKLIGEIRKAKMFGFTREIFFNSIVLDKELLSQDKPTRDYIISMTNDLWDEVEKHN